MSTSMSTSVGVGQRQVTAPVTDSVRVLRRAPVHQAVTQAIEILDTRPDAAETRELLDWLRSAVNTPDVSADVRIRLADLFSARGEPDFAASTLRPLVNRRDAQALPALVRLAELAQQRGDTDETARYYEEILAIDLVYPGVRERLAKLRGPVRAGVAGATLLAPEAARLAHGRLELLRELGRGGAGAVFLARDCRAEREVALKIYHPARRADRDARLKAEAQIAASLASRHVVRVYDLFEDLGGLSMEYCPTGALRSAMIRGEGTVRIRRTWIYGVAHALAVAHDRGWVHRDLKPGNVLLRADGAAVLTDFGLARRVGSSIEPYDGTPGYVAPEVRSRLMADPRLDVYAFGALARELLSTKDPQLAELLAPALANDPETRPRDGSALLRILESVDSE